ncbi:MAG: hypothetical protein K0B05_07210 [Bacteroidales bacterium]|nr:hypothetical protein [Bacteroidales bacterium]
MDNATISQKERLKTYWIYVLVIATVLILYYTVMLVVSPWKKLSDIRSEYGIKGDDSNKIDENIIRDSTYIRLVKEKGFLRSKIVMAGTDSLYIIVNIADSTVSIGISGVVVHSSKISRVQISKILNTVDEYAISGLFASPLNIIYDYSTIRKEPLMIKTAPRDTSEYRPDIIPDTSYIEPAGYILETDRDVRIFIYQEELATIHDKLRLFRFDLNDRIRSAWQSLKRITIFRVPEYQPYIKIRVSKYDARILYRALPRNGQIAVCL